MRPHLKWSEMHFFHVPIMIAGPLRNKTSAPRQPSVRSSSHNFHTEPHQQQQHDVLALHGTQIRWPSKNLCNIFFILLFHAFLDFSSGVEAVIISANGLCCMYLLEVHETDITTVCNRFPPSLK